MSDKWYLVKRNWVETARRAPAYGGVGGEVWPFDPQCGEDLKKEEKAIHSHVMSSRDYVSVGGMVELVCKDIALADEYCAMLDSRTGEGWLLELSDAAGISPKKGGFDIGFVTGGFSVVETELIIQGRSGPDLNRWGLFQTRRQAVEYSEQRDDDEELEHLSGAILLAISVLKSPSSE